MKKKKRKFYKTTWSERMDKFNYFVMKHKKKFFWSCFIISLITMIYILFSSLPYKLGAICIVLFSHISAATTFYRFCKGLPDLPILPSPLIDYILPYILLPIIFAL
ncbi:MAG: hypothetical protein E7344_06355 [Clostridiales bacterium]|nr:hypothetical protein [Clostridiales bacterium]